MLICDEAEKAALEYVKKRIPAWSFLPGENSRDLFNLVLKDICYYDLNKFYIEWTRVEVLLMLVKGIKLEQGIKLERGVE